MIRNLLMQEWPDARGFDVLGADVVTRHPTTASSWVDSQVRLRGGTTASFDRLLWYDCVIVGRGERTGLVRDGLAEARHRAASAGWDFGPHGDAGVGAHLVGDALPGQLSSTNLREALFRGDELAVRCMCPEPVAEYLLQHRAELWIRD